MSTDATAGGPEWELGCGRGDITGPAAELGFFGMAKDTQVGPARKENHEITTLILHLLSLSNRSAKAF